MRLKCLAKVSTHSYCTLVWYSGPTLDGKCPHSPVPRSTSCDTLQLPTKHVASSESKHKPHSLHQRGWTHGFITTATFTHHQKSCPWMNPYTVITMQSSPSAKLDSLNNKFGRRRGFTQCRSTSMFVIFSRGEKPTGVNPVSHTMGIVRCLSSLAWSVSRNVGEAGICPGASRQLRHAVIITDLDRMLLWGHE